MCYIKYEKLGIVVLTVGIVTYIFIKPKILKERKRSKKREDIEICWIKYLQTTR